MNHQPYYILEISSPISYTRGMNKEIIQTYATCIVITLAALFIINAADISYPLTITSTTRSSELSVVGEGKVEIVPDTASVNLGISVNDAPTVESAQSQIDTVNNALIASLKGLGVDETDIKTSNYSINPSYNYDGREQQINGYSSNASVTVKTKDIDLVPQIISAATASGANQVNGVNFSIDDPAAFRSQARTLAIENAKKEAASLAKELGIKLGKVTNIVESSSGAPQPFYKSAMAYDELSIESSAPEIEPGSQTITSTVTLYFEKR